MRTIISRRVGSWGIGATPQPFNELVGQQFQRIHGKHPLADLTCVLSETCFNAKIDAYTHIMQLRHTYNVSLVDRNLPLHKVLCTQGRVYEVI